MRELYDEQAKQRQKEAVVKGNKTRHGKPSPVLAKLPGLATTGNSRDLVGQMVGVSGRTIDDAMKVLKRGSPELVRAVVVPSDGPSGTRTATRAEFRAARRTRRSELDQFTAP